MKHADERAAGADTAHHRIDGTIGNLIDHLSRCSDAVCFGVIGIRKLLR